MIPSEGGKVTASHHILEFPWDATWRREGLKGVSHIGFRRSSGWGAEEHKAATGSSMTLNLDLCRWGRCAQPVMQEGEKERRKKRSL